MEHHLFHFQQKKKSLSLLFLLIFCNNTLGIGQQYHSLFLFPVHLGHYRMFKIDMAHVFSLMHSRLRIQEVLIVYSVVHKSIDREIAYSEGSQVLKKVCPLTGIDAIIRQPGFYNDARCTDMRPFNRNSEPRVTAAPTSRTYQDIILSLIQELLVQLFYLPGNILIVGSAVIIGLYIDHILQFVHDSMP